MDESIGAYRLANANFATLKPMKVGNAKRAFRCYCQLSKSSVNANLLEASESYAHQIKLFRQVSDLPPPEMFGLWNEPEFH
ncbi:hypothetical protein L596_011931 [Steinernema carpocapsae]|uniref:Uncharacterized protein n=1 Tax=Steinernema carpocapsae TaxID=34508 RepID=A0A4U5NWD7_STECR|nr:hypothetical protein L596_011931 [Steinernema carpocapsae]